MVYSPFFHLFWFRAGGLHLKQAWQWRVTCISGAVAQVLLLDHNKISGPLTEVNNSSVPRRVRSAMGELEDSDGVFLGYNWYNPKSVDFSLKVISE